MTRASFLDHGNYRNLSVDFTLHTARLRKENTSSLEDVICRVGEDRVASFEGCNWTTTNRESVNAAVEDFRSVDVAIFIIRPFMDAELNEISQTL